MTVSGIADLPDLRAYDHEVPELRLTGMGYVPTGDWTAAGLGHTVAPNQNNELPV
ncbi:hypothetical protein [Streptomyces sp. NPDC051572]|uniref:hypothetical protein n=1 Tax=Streptomyces sp. NPDC051572 TaxID=3155802 RepID=UPI00344E7005